MRQTTWLVILLAVMAIGSSALGQHEKQRFHGNAPGHKTDFKALFNEAQSLEESSEGQAVLRNCLKAYGGLEKLKSFDGALIKYDNRTSDNSEPVEVVKSFQRGRKYRTVKGIDTRLINNLSCWYEHEDQVAELDGTRYRAELFSYLTLMMPMAAKTERFDSIRHGKRDNDPLDYLYFVKTDSLMIILGIDPEEHLIRSSTGIIPQGDMNFTYINEFSNFSNFDGFIFPGKITYFSLGMRVGNSVIREVEINPTFNDNEFLPRNKVN